MKLKQSLLLLLMLGAACAFQAAAQPRYPADVATLKRQANFGLIEDYTIDIPEVTKARKPDGTWPVRRTAVSYLTSLFKGDIAGYNGKVAPSAIRQFEAASTFPAMREKAFREREHILADSTLFYAAIPVTAKYNATSGTLRMRLPLALTEGFLNMETKDDPLFEDNYFLAVNIAPSIGKKIEILPSELLVFVRITGADKEDPDLVACRPVKVCVADTQSGKILYSHDYGVIEVQRIDGPEIVD